MNQKEEKIPESTYGRRVRAAPRWRVKHAVHPIDLECVLNRYDEAGYEVYSMFQIGERFTLIFIDADSV